MDIVGPISGHKKNTLILYMVMLVGFGLWCLYDGYLNKDFISKHTENGKPNGNLVFNRYAPFGMILGAAALGAGFYRIRDRKVVATDTELIVDGRLKVLYSTIEQIDKTHFEKKGFFLITYKTESGMETTARLSDRDYDNLGPILDRLVEKITN